MSMKPTSALVDRCYYDNVQRGLTLAVNMLSAHEPPDSRAVSDEFVALAALSIGDDSEAVMKVIEAALEKTK